MSLGSLTPSRGQAYPRSSDGVSHPPGGQAVRSVCDLGTPWVMTPLLCNTTPAVFVLVRVPQASMETSLAVTTPKRQTIRDVSDKELLNNLTRVNIRPFTDTEILTELARRDTARAANDTQRAVQRAFWTAVASAAAAATSAVAAVLTVWLG